MTRQPNNHLPRRVLVAVLASLLAAACGTTVPQASVGQAAAGANGTGQTTDSGLAPGAPGSAQLPAGVGGAVGGTSAGAAAGGAAGGGTVGAANGGTRDVAAAPNSVAAPGSNAAPVKIGFMLIDYSGAAASFGFSGKAPDVFLGFKEMVSYLNKHGGLGGRQIKGDYYSIDGTSNNANTAYQAACTHFTQDAHVEVVISDGTFHPTFEACMAKAHLAHLDVTPYGLDLTGQRQYPNYLTPTAFAVDRYSADLVETVTAAGIVAKGQKIGVLIEGCENNIRAYNEAYAPAAKRLGLQIEAEQTVCNNGTGDLGTETSQIQSAVLRFRSDGVTSVGFVSFNEGFLAVLFGQGAEQQGWRPQYLLSSVALPERGVESQGNGLAMPTAQLPQIRGMGWIPVTDVGGTPPPGTDAQQAQKKLCREMTPSQGGAASAPDSGVRRDFLGHVLRECDIMLLTRQIMSMTGGQITLDAVRSVYAKALDSLVSASNLTGAYRASGARTDGVFAGAPFAYNRSCKCVRYTGPARTFS